MTLIKICGMTRPEDAALATDLGADFIGFIFVKESPRCVTPERARELAGGIRTQRPSRVGVFRDTSAREINTIARTAGLDLVQLHGNEADAMVSAIELPCIKAVRVTEALPDTHTSAAWLMFDTGGGTGRTFDWSLLENYPRTTPFFLAGGLTPDNVADAIRIARPDAIDLSSGVESAPGIKDPDKMKSLFARVTR
ncbi:MAG: phosphoribosylanthranilate isomerase [Acidobacteriota bacterium]